MDVSHSPKKPYVSINTALFIHSLLTLGPLAAIFSVSNTWWGLGLKGLCILFLLSVLRNLFYTPLWARAEGYPAGVVVNMILLGAMWFWREWVLLIGLLMVVSIGTMRMILRQNYTDDFRASLDYQEPSG